MDKVKIIVDNFMLGRRRIPKGEVLELAAPIARYAVKIGSVEYVPGDPEPVVEAEPKPPAKKKRAYKRRDMKAET